LGRRQRGVGADIEEVSRSVGGSRKWAGGVGGGRGDCMGERAGGAGRGADAAKTRSRRRRAVRTTKQHAGGRSGTPAASPGAGARSTGPPRYAAWGTTRPSAAFAPSRPPSCAVASASDGSRSGGRGDACASLSAGSAPHPAPGRDISHICPPARPRQRRAPRAGRARGGGRVCWRGGHRTAAQAP
jgi:hypothetical protein